jgi:kynurenine formamidase
MKVTVNIGGRDYAVATGRAHDISIPVRFDDVQLSAFGAPPARMAAYEAGSFVGAVARGGSCNCETYTITPHCNGTHTEGVGHITSARLSVRDMVGDGLVPATLVTVTPSVPTEGYEPTPQVGDLMITRAALMAALKGLGNDFIDALVIRTAPNGADKRTRDYGAAMPPYFSHDAMRLIVEKGVRHLLVDMPSVDRLDDGGRLGNHRIFWGVDAGDRNAPPSPKTITELVYVPDALPDGHYILNLQVASFDADAAPSRPILYEVENV